MREGQVRHDLPRNHAIGHVLIGEDLAAPGDIVVREHHCLGRPCGAGGVDERHAVARAQGLHAGIELARSDVSPHGHELLPAVHRNTALLGNGFVDFTAPHHDGLEVRQGRGERSVLLQLLVAVQYHEVGLAVLGDVVAGVGGAGDVNASGDPACTDTSIARCDIKDIQTADSRQTYR
jgi:hypothetical protein